MCCMKLKKQVLSILGYTGSQCGTNINECVGSSCPTAASCIDGINTYTCQCNDGKVGSNCDKGWYYILTGSLGFVKKVGTILT